MNKTACNNDCNRILKQGQPWLKQVDKFALTNAIYALDAAYQRFFRKQGGYPRFKSRHHSGMPHYYRKNQKNLAKAQRKLKAKQLQSANYRKQQKRVARVAKKAANQRKDFLHKKSTEIANQYDLVCVEDLSLKALANRGYEIYRKTA